MFRRTLLLALIYVLTAQPGNAKALNPHTREVAITFDDLPVASTLQDDKSWQEITRKLLKTITTNKLPVVAFVNENKLYVNGSLDPDRLSLLKAWLDAGLELGNHTFSHPSLNSTPLPDFEADLLRGEAIIRSLMADHGKTLRYFRHPFLHTGRTIETRDQFESFLHAHGYTVAPVTIDNSDWIFARAYDNARDKNDREAMKRVAAAYVPYIKSKFIYFEDESRKLFGRHIKQVLLLHANSINADHFGEIVAMLKQLGYRFVTLGDALTDPAYLSADTFTGPQGISWIDRWALTRHVAAGFFQKEPRTPAFVMKLAGVESE
jgi:peptidoglycan/xylan/chitin deacetylase (PgdA/CDA1 family)